MTAEGRFYSPLVWSLGLLFAASGVVLSVLMVSSILGPFEFLDRSTPFAPARSGIWWPGSAPGSEADGARRVDAWRAALGSESSPTVARELAKLREQGVELVAVTDATRLTGDEREALLSFAAEGGGALLTGAVSIRDREGAWLGWGAMASLLGVAEISAVDAQASRGLRCAKRGPVSASLPPGCHVPLAATPGAPAIDEEGAELWWQSGGETRRGASRRLRVGEGRIVWLGAGPESGLGNTDPRHDPVHKLIRSASAWAAGTPFLEVLAWPEGRQFAAELPAGTASAMTKGTGEQSPAEAASDGQAPTLSEPLSRRVAQARERGARIRLSTRELAPVPGAPGPLEALRAHGAWLASTADIEDWSRQQAGILTALEVAGPRRLLLTVTNRGREPVEELALRVHLNRPYDDLDVAAMAVLQAAPSMRVAEGGRSVDLLLPRLSAGTSYTWALDGMPAFDGASSRDLVVSDTTRAGR